jgi:hypothetical protein
MPVTESRSSTKCSYNFEPWKAPRPTVLLGTECPRAFEDPKRGTSRESPTTVQTDAAHQDCHGASWSP